jgi:hypothetical protein
VVARAARYGVPCFTGGGRAVTEVRRYAGSSKKPFDRIDRHGEGRGGGWLKFCTGIVLQSYGLCASWSEALAIEVAQWAKLVRSVPQVLI